MTFSREEYHQLQQRSDTLKKILSSIPRVIDNRPVFLDVSSSTFSAIKGGATTKTLHKTINCHRTGETDIFFRR